MNPHIMVHTSFRLPVGAHKDTVTYLTEQNAAHLGLTILKENLVKVERHLDPPYGDICTMNVCVVPFSQEKE